MSPTAAGSTMRADCPPVDSGHLAPPRASPDKMQHVDISTAKRKNGGWASGTGGKTSQELGQAVLNMPLYAVREEYKGGTTPSGKVGMRRMTDWKKDEGKRGRRKKRQFEKEDGECTRGWD